MTTLLITGASSGIGRALALMASKKNDTLCLTARREDRLQTLKKEIEANGGKAFIKSCDITQQKEVHEMVHYFESKCRKIDTLVLNAGISKSMHPPPFKANKIIDIFETNFMGSLYAIEAILPRMISQKSGHIVGISSLASLVAAKGSGGYAASKASLNMILESLRREIKGHNIDVSTICPGFIKTHITASNKFPMPFLLELEDGAKKIYNAIQKKKVFYAFPWPMVLAIRLGKCMPMFLQDFIMRSHTNLKAEHPIRNWDT